MKRRTTTSGPVARGTAVASWSLLVLFPHLLLPLLLYPAVATGSVLRSIGEGSSSDSLISFNNNNNNNGNGVVPGDSRQAGCRTNLTDVPSKAFLAKIVFEGTVKETKHPTLTGMRMNHPETSSATLVVNKIYKGDFRDTTIVKVKYSTRVGSSTKNFPQDDGEDGEEEEEAECRFRPDIFESGKKYVVFANDIDSSNSFTLFSEPVIQSKDSSRQVRKIICKGCARKPTVSGLKDTVEVTLKQKNVKLKCKARGHPPPEITWYKDDQPIKHGKNIGISTKKGNSTLTIKRVSSNDAGLYECRAQNAVGTSEPIHSDLKIRPKKSPDHSITTLKPQGRDCDIQNLNSFCLNGGTCTFWEDIQEYSCRCPDGYTGMRCERKEVILSGIVRTDFMGSDASTKMHSIFWGK